MTRVKCPNCQQMAEFKHFHDEAHGIAGTHMVGTERFECQTCRTSIFANSKGASNFNFRYDMVPHDDKT